jgi:hypothetical protein
MCIEVLDLVQGGQGQECLGVKLSGQWRSSTGWDIGVVAPAASTSVIRYNVQSV